MPAIHRAALVPHTPAQMFELVSDIESYPLFLPWCRRARVERHGPNDVTATLEIAKGPLAKAFCTRNRSRPSERIEMQLVSGPFKALHGEWRFSQCGELCRVEFNLAFDYSSRLLAATLGPLFTHAADTLVGAFCGRADELYAR